MRGVEDRRERPGVDVPGILDIAGVDAVAERVRVVGAGPAAALLVYAVGRDENAQPVAHVVEKLQAVAHIVLGLRRAEVEGAHVVVVGSVLEGIAREAHGGVLAQGQVDHAPEDLHVVVAHLGLQCDFRTAEPRSPGNDVDGAGGGVAFAQGALGADIDFHPADVEEGGADAGRAWNVDAIQVRRRRRIAQLRVVRGSDPSNPHLDVAALVADLEAGRQFAQVGEVLNALHLEVVALEAVGGHAQILEVLFAPLDGDDDLFDIGTRLGIRLRTLLGTLLGTRLSFGLFRRLFASAWERREGKGSRSQRYKSPVNCYLHCVSLHLFHLPL